MLIHPYSTRWKKQYEQIQKIVLDHLTTVDCSMAHIGSTAVENLDAKPIIDIDIIFYHPDDFEIIKHHLEQLGYHHNGNQGIPDREVFKRNKLSFHPVLDTIAHHLYVCSHQSEELKKHILVRDYLQNNKEAKESYKTLKYKLAEEAKQNKKVYAQLKEEQAKDFFKQILSKAQKEENL